MSSPFVLIAGDSVAYQSSMRFGGAESPVDFYHSEEKGGLWYPFHGWEGNDEDSGNYQHAERGVLVKDGKVFFVYSDRDCKRCTHVDLEYLKVPGSFIMLTRDGRMADYAAAAAALIRDEKRKVTVRTILKEFQLHGDYREFFNCHISKIDTLLKKSLSCANTDDKDKKDETSSNGSTSSGAGR